MKNVIIAIVLLFSIQSFSQDYIPFPDSNVIWKNEEIVTAGSGGNVVQIERYYYLLNEQFLINGVSYNMLKMNGIRHYWNGNEDNYIDDVIIGGIRQEKSEKKVYFYSYNSEQEYILYDFSLSIGDTLKNSIGQYYYLYDPTITDIDSILVKGIYHKRFKLTGIETDSLYHIEGIGSTLGLFIWGEDSVGGNRLVCFKKDGEDIYPENGDCEIMYSNELSENELLLYPNPVSTYFSISQKSKKQLKIELFDMQGRKVLSKLSDEVLINTNVSNLNNGFYFLKIEEDGNQIHSEKLIIIN